VLTCCHISRATVLVEGLELLPDPSRHAVDLDESMNVTEETGAFVYEVVDLLNQSLLGQLW
jgi:hypothetical protein